MKKKIICFDLDNVICNTKKNYYSKSTPKKNVIKIINELYKKNYKIKIFTARGMGTYKGNLKMVEKKYRKLTKLQLKKWNVNYHDLILGKPSFDIYIDDKNYGFKKTWYKNFNLKMKKKIKALILCGGKGTRYNKNQKNKILKPLVNINGKTILERIIEIYYRNGISEFVLLGGYKINNLKNFVKKKLKNYNITVLNTGLNTETGGRLLFAKKIISDDTFLFTYGDSIADFNLSRAIIMKKRQLYYVFL